MGFQFVIIGQMREKTISGVTDGGDPATAPTQSVNNEPTLSKHQA